MRIVNRLLAFIVAVALAAAAVIVIVEVIAARAGAAPVIVGWHSILRWGRHNTWNADSVEVACVVSAVIGLLLLVLQLRRRRPTRVAVTSSSSTDAALTRKGISVTIRGAVTDVEGISASSAKVGHRRIKVNATSAGHDDTARELKPTVRAAAQNKLDELQLASNRRLKVSVNGRKNAGQ